MNQLVLFAKYWQPGQVKTRLASDIGPQSAADLQRAFLATLMVRMASCGEQRTCVFSPPSRGSSFADLAESRSVGSSWRFMPQIEGDLGTRLHGFLHAESSVEGCKTVVIGSDSPNLPVAWVERAFELLDEANVVLGPAADGGYYLLAVRPPHPPIFDSQIAWGTNRVFHQTVSRLKTSGVTFRLLSQWYDIDSLSDLSHLARELADPRTALPDPELARLARQVQAVLNRGE